MEGRRQSYDDQHQNLNSPLFGGSRCLIRNTAKKGLDSRCEGQVFAPAFMPTGYALGFGCWLVCLVIGWKHGIKHQRNQLHLFVEQLITRKGKCCTWTVGLGGERLVWRVAWLACCVQRSKRHASFLCPSQTLELHLTPPPYPVIGSRLPS